MSCMSVAPYGLSQRALNRLLLHSRQAIAHYLINSGLWTRRVPPKWRTDKAPTVLEQCPQFVWNAMA